MGEKNIILYLVGDIFPANLGYNTGFGVSSKFLKHHGKLWAQSTKEILGDADIVFCNLESPLIHDKEFSNNNSFAGHETFAEFLKHNKIGIVSISNNHILEQGIDGFNSTCEILEKNKIKYIGKNENNLSNIEIININGIKIGFCAFNGIQDIDNPDLYAELEESYIMKTIDKLKSMKLDYKIISLHWGNEYINYPSLNQIKLAHKIIDKGINIIAGQHPHVIQPIEEYNSGLIFYSLGNFLFDMLWSKNVRHGLAVRLILNKNKRIDYKLINIQLQKDYSPKFFPNGKQKLKKINENYQELLKLAINNPKKYNSMYFRNLSFLRLYERLLMKLYLFKNWSKIDNRSKKIFFKKIKSKIW